MQDAAIAVIVELIVCIDPYGRVRDNRGSVRFGNLDLNALAAIRAVQREIERFSAELAGKPRWLVMNKIDLLDAGERRRRCDALLAALDWQGPAFAVSAATGEGTDELARKIATALGCAAEAAVSVAQ